MRTYLCQVFRRFSTQFSLLGRGIEHLKETEPFKLFLWLGRKKALWLLSMEQTRPCSEDQQGRSIALQQPSCLPGARVPAAHLVPRCSLGCSLPSVKVPERRHSFLTKVECLKRVSFLGRVQLDSDTQSCYFCSLNIAKR